VTKSNTLEKLLLDHLENFELSGSVGNGYNLPVFELYAIDYLEFAEKRLNNIDKYKDDIDELINCVAHLKRAVDCQLDTFFHSVGLLKKIQDNNLKFKRKLDFLKGIGIFSSRSLNRLNTLRNKMEHHYQIPKIIDIELYYDLVSSFISVIQGLIFLLGFNREVDFFINNEDHNCGYFQSAYDDKNLEIRITWNIRQSDNQNQLTAKIDDYEDFIYFFKVHILIIQLGTYANWKHIYNRIKMSKIRQKE
jgi:hypothetical protein